MFTEIRKGLLNGLGAVFLSRERVEGVVRRLVHEAELSPEQGRRLSEELMKSAQGQWKEMETGFRDLIHKCLEGTDVGYGAQLQELRSRVEMLEKRLSRLDKGGPVERV